MSSLSPLFGFFVRSELWRHAKESPFRCQNNEEEKHLVYSVQILLYSNFDENSDLQENIQEILTGMKSDDVLKAIQSDNCLMSFGSAMLKRVGRGRYLMSDKSCVSWDDF